MIETRLTPEERAEIEALGDTLGPEVARDLARSVETVLSALERVLDFAERVERNGLNIYAPEFAPQFAGIDADHRNIASRAGRVLAALEEHLPHIRQRVEGALTAEQIAHARIVAPRG